MDDNVILTRIINGSDSALSTIGTTPNGLSYVLTMSDETRHPVGLYSGYIPSTVSDTNHAVGLYAIGLPFTTSTHLIATPKNQQTTLNVPSHTANMEPVVLEGDYVDYFTLYASQGEQIDSRVILNPAAMAFSIDFCATYNWEIANDTLYFAAATLLPSLAIVDNFVEKITPADHVEAGIQLHQRPQVPEKLSDSPSPVMCPICTIALRSGKDWLACPNGHGYFLTSGQLETTRQHMNDMQRAIEKVVGSRPNVLYPAVTGSHGELKCPNDGNTLVGINYQGIGATLYTCQSCMHHWIDGQDLDTILGKFRNDGSDDPDSLYV